MEQTRDITKFIHTFITFTKFIDYKRSTKWQVKCNYRQFFFITIVLSSGAISENHSKSHSMVNNTSLLISVFSKYKFLLKLIVPEWTCSLILFSKVEDSMLPFLNSDLKLFTLPREWGKWFKVVLQYSHKCEWKWIEETDPGCDYSVEIVSYCVLFTPYSHYLYDTGEAFVKIYLTKNNREFSIF